MEEKKKKQKQKNKSTIYKIISSRHNQDDGNERTNELSALGASFFFALKLLKSEEKNLDLINNNNKNSLIVDISSLMGESLSSTQLGSAFD